MLLSHFSDKILVAPKRWQSSKGNREHRPAEPVSNALTASRSIA
jgi:hypothetical protein